MPTPFSECSLVLLLGITLSPVKSLGAKIPADQEVNIEINFHLIKTEFCFVSLVGFAPLVPQSEYFTLMKVPEVTELNSSSKP